MSKDLFIELTYQVMQITCTEVVLKLKSISGNAIFLSVGDVPEEVGVVQYVVFIQPQVWTHLWPRICCLICIHRH